MKANIFYCGKGESNLLHFASPQVVRTCELIVRAALRVKTGLNFGFLQNSLLTPRCFGVCWKARQALTLQEGGRGPGGQGGRGHSRGHWEGTWGTCNGE